MHYTFVSYGSKQIEYILNLITKCQNKNKNEARSRARHTYIHTYIHKSIYIYIYIYKSRVKKIITIFFF